MEPLTEQEAAVLQELARLAGTDRIVTGLELLDHGFADFVGKVYHKRLGYPGSLKSRVFQILRKKGYILMERRNRGTYTILPRKPRFSAVNLRLLRIIHVVLVVLLLCVVTEAQPSWRIYNHRVPPSHLLPAQHLRHPSGQTNCKPRLR